MLKDYGTPTIRGSSTGTSKPGNILIAPDGTPKITDWGLSKAEGTKQSGLIGFSLEYAAPEQLAPNLYGEPGPWTDIYQMGVLFYEMLSGHVPFSRRRHGGDHACDPAR